MMKFCRLVSAAQCLQQQSRMFSNSKIFLACQLIKSPPFPESITDGDIRYLKKIGDPVQVDEVVAEIETDKTTMPVSSPVSGIITKILFEDGSKVTAADDLFELDQQEVAKSAPKVATKVDTKAVEPKSKPEQPKQQDKSQSNLLREDTRVKMTRLRKTVAGRLKSAQNTAAMLTTFNEVDMTNLTSLRKKYQEQFTAKHNIKLGFMSAFIAAAGKSLVSIPEVNAYIEEDEIVYHNYVDISVAVATPKGLVVPIIRNVHQMNFAQIELALSELSKRARDNKLAAEDMDGGTFTISNGGVFGSLMGTPIINPPQSAILGMHAINMRPMVMPNGQIEARPMMYLALTYDHRIVDGREAVTFLKNVKQAIEDPTVLLLDL